MNRGNRKARVIAGAAGDDRHRDALGFQAEHQIADVERHIDHQQVSAAARAQHSERLLGCVRMSDGRALVHCELDRGGEQCRQVGLG